MRHFAAMSTEESHTTFAFVTEETSNERHKSYEARYADPWDEACMWIVCFGALLANSLTIATMQRTKHGIGQKARLYIISLAISDFLMFPTLLLELTLSRTGHLFKPIFEIPDDPRIIRSETISNIILAMFYYVGLCTNLLSMFAVAVDRLLAVMHPVFYRTYVTEFRIIIILLGIWTYALFAGSWILIYTGLYVTTPEKFLATMTPTDYLTDEIYKFVMVPHSLILVTGSAVTYAITYYSFKKIGHLREKNSSDNKDKAAELKQKNLQKNRRLFRMLVATVSLQTLLWTPYIFIYYFGNLNKPDTLPILTNYVQPITYLLINLNSIVNPFLYSAMNKDYRKAYLTTLGLNRRHRVQQGSTNTGNTNVTTH